MSILITPVREADVPEVIALVIDTLAEFGLTFGVGARTDDQLRELPRSYTAHGGQFWIARRADSGVLIGTCGMFPIADGVVELRKMYLAPAARGLGAGGQMFEVAEAWARAVGARQIVLDTIHAMTRAIAFYESHGFVRDDSFISGARCERGYAKNL